MLNILTNVNNHIPPSMTALLDRLNAKLGDF